MRFLGFFKDHGYDKFVRFSSNVRFELLKDLEMERKQEKVPFRVRVIFDGLEIQVAGCDSKYCKFEQF